MITEKFNVYSFQSANSFYKTEYKCLKYHTSNLSLLSFSLQLLVEIVILDKSKMITCVVFKDFFANILVFVKLIKKNYLGTFLLNWGIFCFIGHHGSLILFIIWFDYIH